MPNSQKSAKPSILRCGAFEINLADAEVRRHGVRVKLQERPFQILVTLLERPGALVTREELREKLWADNTYVDFERSLNVAMNKLRTALGETSESPRYIETIRGRGYRFMVPTIELDGQPLIPENGTALTKSLHGSTFGIRNTVVIAGIGLALLSAYFMLKPAAAPRVVEYLAITHNGNPKSGPLMTDGLYVYFEERSGGHSVLVRVPAVGGETSPVLSLDNVTVEAFSPVRPEVLVRYGPEREAPLFVYSLFSGSRRPLDQLRGSSATWCPTGQLILYSFGNGLYTARNDGSQPRKLGDLPFRAGQMSWSPDGRVLRLQAFERGIWECSSDGGGLHRLQTAGPGEFIDAGKWTPDGKYYFFSQSRGGRRDLWVLKAVGRKPVPLTAGQLNLFEPVPSRDGERLFALGALPRVEFVRYDSRLGVFNPYLSEISADALAFSRDGRWIAYTSYPDHSLWRSRADGSERMQLTFAPNETLMPRWSPDGKRIAFMSHRQDGRWKIYTIASSGGPAEQLVPGEEEAGNPTWSPDGRTLASAGTPWIHGFAPRTSAIHLLDLKTREATTLSDSDGLWAPRWSYDGKYLVAETLDSRNLLTYEFSTRKWAPLASAGDETIGYSSWSSDSRFVYYNTYSRGPGKIFRVSVTARQAELVAALKNLSEAETLGRFFTLAPDDTPLLLRDTSITEVYSLRLLLP
jgi:Tol biopolymer transport system component/DNA-binding winged helix-turn-helix (wHTH) protein